MTIKAKPAKPRRRPAAKRRTLWASRDKGMNSILFWSDEPKPREYGFDGNAKLAGLCGRQLRKYAGFTLRPGRCVEVEVTIRRVK